ncbi:MAG: VOC family protein [Chloroflexota bacterium]
MNDQPKLKLKGVSQIALVVKDLDRAMEAYWKILGIGPWKIYLYEPGYVKDMQFRGQPDAYRAWVALAEFGGQVIELMQHIDGESLYTEFSAKHGEGVQHLGAFVEDFAQALEDARAAGFKVLQSGHGYGKQGDGAFAYLDTSEELGIIWELIEVPRERSEPVRVYPPQG